MKRYLWLVLVACIVSNVCISYGKGNKIEMNKETEFNAFKNETNKRIGKLETDVEVLAQGAANVGIGNKSNQARDIINDPGITKILIISNAVTFVVGIIAFLMMFSKFTTTNQKLKDREQWLKNKGETV